MQMRMVQQILPPGVKNGKETNLCSEVFGVACNGQECVRSGSEEDAVDSALVL